MDISNSYNEAASLYNAQRFSEASDLFSNLVRHDPADPVFAYAMLMCLSKLGVPNVAERLPPELEEKREQLGLMFRQENLANALRARGFTVQGETKEYTSDVIAQKGDDRFLVQFSDIFGSISSNTYRAAHREAQWERIEPGAERNAVEREIRALVLRAHVEIYPLSRPYDRNQGDP